MLNDTLKNLRLAHGWTQVDIAKALGVSKQSVSNWENDNILPSIDMLIKIAELFSVSTDYLLGKETTLVLDVSGLTDSQAAHIQELISDLKTANKNRTD